MLRKKKLIPLNTERSVPEIAEILDTSGKIYIDGTEQPVRRPVDPESQKLNYSGKKKQHTSKVVVITNEEREIKAITPVYVGSSHDFGMFKEEDLIKALPLKTPIYVDTGFQGIKGLNEELNIKQPKKKPKSRKLNGGEKLGNSFISSERVKVEHAICGLKRFQVVSGVFRGITHSMNTTMEICAGLWNLHLRHQAKPSS